MENVLAAVHGQECVAVEVINTAHAIGLDRWTSGHLERNGTSSQVPRTGPARAMRVCELSR